MTKNTKRKIKKELRRISSSSNIDESLFSLYEDKFRGSIFEDDYVKVVKGFIAAKIQYTTGFENLKWKDCKFPYKTVNFYVTDNTGKKTLKATAVTLSEPFLGTPLPNRNGRVYPAEEVKKALDKFVGVDVSSTKDSDETAILTLTPKMIGDKVVSYSIVGPYARAVPVAEGGEISLERMAETGFKIGQCFFKKEEDQFFYKDPNVKVELNDKNELICTEVRNIKVPSFVKDIPKEERLKYYEEYLGLEFKEEEK